jgi:CelD/BcsL family acetyltransferase involved in cellulose biosynthesis
MIVKDYDLNCVEISIIGDDRSFCNLEPEWNDLWQRACNARFYQRYDWCGSAWHNCLCHQGYKLHVVCARQQGKLVAVLPLIKKGGVFRRPEYGFLTCLEHPKDALIDTTLAKSDNLRSVLLQMTETCSGRLKISPVRNGSVLHDCADQAKFVLRPALNAHVAVLPDSNVEGFIRQRSKSAMVQERRGYRLLMRQGAVSVSFCKSDEDFDRVFARLVRLKRAWLLRKKKTSSWLSDDQAVAALKAFTKRAILAGHGHLQSINVDGECAAINLSFQDNDTLTSFTSSYDPAYSRVSVGKLGMLTLMRRALTDGLRVIDHLGGTTELKLAVSNQVIEQYTIEIK